MDNLNNDGSIGIVKISDEVVSVIAGIAAEEIQGVVEFQQGVGNNITNLLKPKKSSGKSVKVTLGENSAVIDLNLSVQYGLKIQEVIESVQENVKKTVEAMTGLKVDAINVNVQSIYQLKEVKEVKETKEVKEAKEVVKEKK